VHTAGERLTGYRDALAHAGVPDRSELVHAGTHDAVGAERAVRALLRLPLARRPTALFCANNRNTVGALRALRDHPRPLALIGFDDFELADMLATPVSVVRHAPEELGRVAVELAYARLGGNGGPPLRHTIPCEVVARGSGEVPA
jgi:LacI family transcriptional regulator